MPHCHCHCPGSLGSPCGTTGEQIQPGNHDCQGPWNNRLIMIDPCYKPSHWLVVSNMNGLFPISYMGCHPKPIDELHHFSRWLKWTTPCKPSNMVPNMVDSQGSKYAYSLGIMVISRTILDPSHLWVPNMVDFPWDLNGILWWSIGINGTIYPLVTYQIWLMFFCFVKSRAATDEKKSLISLLFCGFLGDHFPYFSSWKQQIFPDPPHLGVRFFPHDAKTIVLISLSLIFECLSYSFIAIFSQCHFRGSKKWGLPSGKRLHNWWGKSPFFMGKLTN